MALTDREKAAMLNNAQYWRERSIILENAQYNKTADYFRTIEREYNKAIAQTEKDINAWYSRFATENKVSFQDAQRMLNARELDEFKWTVEDYIKYGQQNAVNQQWIKQLENASARYHITRLEALKVQMQNQVEVLMGTERDGVSNLIESIYTDSYYRSIFDIQRGTGVGFNFSKLDADGIQRVMSKPWTPDGTNFSSRIWGKHRPELVNDLHTQLTQATIRGDNPKTLAKGIAKRYGAKLHQAENLCLTEGAYFRCKGQLEGYKNSGVDEYEICATLDNRTSNICREMDGKHFPIDKWAVGLTAPPFHNRCRTATMPFFDDEFTADEMRAARDKEGKTYYVPGNMKYNDWFDSVVNTPGKVSDVAKVAVKAAVVKTISAAKNIDEIRQYTRDNWGLAAIHSDVEKLDFETVKETMSRMDEVYQEFPELKNSLKLIKTDKSGFMAVEKIKTGGSALSFNRNMYKPTAIESTVDTFNASVKKRWFTENADIYTNGYHELGHAVEAAIIDRLEYPEEIVLGVWSDCDVANDIVSIACKNAKKTADGKGKRNIDLIRDISRYATENKSETIAEAFADYFNNKGKAKVLSKEIIKEVKKWLRE